MTWLDRIMLALAALRLSTRKPVEQAPDEHSEFLGADAGGFVFHTQFDTAIGTHNHD